MKVRELVQLLLDLPDQDATVVINEGISPGVWLIVTGVIPRRVSRHEANPDFVVPGKEPAVEIV